jgi:hypothetical protein
VENTIWDNEEAGVQIVEGGDPLVERNSILKQGNPVSPQKDSDGNPKPPSKDVPGVWIHSGGLGVLQENDISKSIYHGVVIGTEAQPTLQHNQIHSNRKSGILVQARPPFLCMAQPGPLPPPAVSSPLLLHLLHQFLSWPQAHRLLPFFGHLPFFGQDGGAGTFIENDIHHNYVGVEVVDGSDPTMRGNRIHHQKMGGIWVYKGGKGTYEDNEVFSNRKAS